jgi:hypothetical protein
MGYPIVHKQVERPKRLNFTITLLVYCDRIRLPTHSHDEVGRLLREEQGGVLRAGRLRGLGRSPRGENRDLPEVPENEPVRLISDVFDRKFVCYLHSSGLDNISLGIHVNWLLPNIEIHLPFCFIRIGWQGCYRPDSPHLTIGKKRGDWSCE